jgi:hypothetical protein
MLRKALSLAVDDVFGNYWWYAFNINFCFRVYVNVATLTLQLFITQETRQAVNRLQMCALILIKMTDEMPLLLAPRDKFMILNKFDGKFSVNFPIREDWSKKCVNFVAPDGLVFFADGSFCRSTAGAGVFSDILNGR